MRSLSKIWMVILFVPSAINSFAQIRNTKTATVKVNGNCDMCKTTIEKAGKAKNTATVEWNKDSRMASISYDSTKTSPEEILKRIALAGYDNETFRAPDDVYTKLPECCHYDRAIKSAPQNKETTTGMKTASGEHDHSTMSSSVHGATQSQAQLKPVFDNYFSIKDALVNTDSRSAAAKAAQLTSAIRSVDMNKLSAEEHKVWMTVMKDLSADAENISKATNIADQRIRFTTLSRNMYELIKVAKPEGTVYYQHCPMYNDGKGADWLSKESAIRNPYYGATMLTCGSTTETIK